MPFGFQKLFFLYLIGWLVGWLVVFYGISTLVGYLIPNPLYTFVLWELIKINKTKLN